jgi:hypothetical protein
MTASAVCAITARGRAQTRTFPPLCIDDSSGRTLRTFPPLRCDCLYVVDWLRNGMISKSVARIFPPWMRAVRNQTALLWSYSAICHRSLCSEAGAR